MRPTTFEVMHEQIRAIYRAVTGADMSVPDTDDVAQLETLGEDEVERRFADLEAAARRIPEVARRVPPFSFTPPIDAIEDERELLIEVAVPGVDRGDVEVEFSGTTLTISGLRSGERVSSERSFYCAEIPRGPFRRDIELPCEITESPRVRVENGIVFVHVAKPSEPEKSGSEPKSKSKSKSKSKAKVKA